MNELAPILLFTYKRLSTLIKTVEALKLNTQALESDLYIFSDGAKSNSDQSQIQHIRSYLKTITGFRKIIIFESPENKGLAKSIIEGVSKVIKLKGKVIVLEDDLITTSNFLTYMNFSLDKYQFTNQVFSISGYSFNLGIAHNETQDSYFLNRGWSWGWATWEDRWTAVDWDVKEYKNFVNDGPARKEFSKGGSDLNDMLQKQMSGELDSWAIRWFFHQYQVKGLTLYPILSKIDNAGFDQDATHTTGSSKRYLPKLDNKLSEEFLFPQLIEVTPFYQKRFQSKMGIHARIWSKIETLVKNLLIFGK
jgi:hypothetical protein